METEIVNEKGVNFLVIKVPMQRNPEESSSGKTRLAYSSGGFLKTPLTHPETGKPISVSMMATIPNR